jgi:hypothetical protein
MAVMMAKLYQALRAANVSDDAAREAAEEAASHENRFAKIEADLLLLKWMVGFNLAIGIAIASKLVLMRP